MTQQDGLRTYDLLVVGAGPAGATAAALCAGKGVSVALIDQRPQPRKYTQRVWVNAEIRKLLEACGVMADAVLGEALTALTFCSPTYTRTITSRLHSPAVHVVDRARLENALIDAAVAAGASLRTGQHVAGLDILEEKVRLTFSDGSEVDGRFLVGADGARSLVGRQLGLTGHIEPKCWCAQWDGHRSKARPLKPAGADKGMIVVLGLIRSQGIGYVLPQADHLLLGVAGPSNEEEIAEHFQEFVGDAREAGLLPDDVRPGKPDVWPSPAGQAIDMEAHVGKRSLLVGEAGGFVTAVSYEGIYPAMWSASIAAGVLIDAAGSDTPQDVLGQYDHRWRLVMADYLRMPNADVEFLLPLIFSNQQIADRMAAAFLTGQNI
jgi:flavin-dependent dehydrogenase